MQQSRRQQSKRSFYFRNIESKFIFRRKLLFKGKEAATLRNTNHSWKIQGDDQQHKPFQYRDPPKNVVGREGALKMLAAHASWDIQPGWGWLEWMGVGPTYCLFPRLSLSLSKRGGMLRQCLGKRGGGEEVGVDREKGGI